MSILYANIKTTVNIHVCIVYCNIRKFQLNRCKLNSEQKVVAFTAECALSKRKLTNSRPVQWYITVRHVMDAR